MFPLAVVLQHARSRALGRRRKQATMADGRLGKIAITALATTAYTAKQPIKMKTELEKKEYKRQADQKRGKSRVNICRAFEKWRELRDSLCLKLD